ncbi:MAG: phage/plasmid primase, P4 family [Terriglobales bacterium]
MSDWKSQLRYFVAHRFVDGCCTCGHKNCDSPGKHPKEKGWQQRATNDPDRVAQIQNDPASNPAIACGKGSNLFVLDVDGIDGLIALAELEKANEPLPPTHKVRTGSGGFHFYFQYPSTPLPNQVKFLPGLDTRSEGGLVIAAGGRNEKGPYIAQNDLEPAILPEWLVAAILTAKTKDSTKTERLIKGNRNNAIFKLACGHHHAGTSYEGALDLCLKEAARAVPPYPEHLTVYAVKSAYGYPTDEVMPLDTSDQGLALTFVESGPLLRYVSDDQSWVAYKGGIWVEDDPASDIAALLKSLEPPNISDPKAAGSIHRRLNSRRAVNDVTFFAEAWPNLRTTAGEFDPDPWVVGLPNGEALDLRTGERRAACPHDLITRALPVAPEGTCQRWLDYLEQTHPRDPELIAYLQRLVGYWLTSSTQEDMIAFFIGVGGSGKGTFAEPLQRILGRYCVPIPIGMLLEDTNEDRRLNYIADLCGARLAVCNEGSKMRRLDSRGIKMLTGGGKAVGRRMGQQPISFQQTHKILILANDNPVLELDSAMKQRVHCIPFNEKFRGEQREEKGLRDVFAQPEQLQGILAWGVEGS